MCKSLCQQTGITHVSEQPAIRPDDVLKAAEERPDARSLTNAEVANLLLGERSLREDGYIEKAREPAFFEWAFLVLALATIAIRLIDPSSDAPLLLYAVIFFVGFVVIRVLRLLQANW